MKCDTHNTDLEDADCWNCNDGSLEEDDDLLGPVSCTCWVCEGRGVLEDWYCPDCEEETEE